MRRPGKTIQATPGGWSRRRSQSRLALRRAQNLALLAYDGARYDRTNNSTPGQSTADEALLDDLPRLRNRSRDTIRNSGMAAGILETFAVNTVGTGISMVPAPRRDYLEGVSLSALEAFKKEAARVWELWGAHADAAGVEDLAGLQELVERSALEGGDCLIHFVSHPDPSRPFRLAVNLLEGEWIDETDHDTMDTGGVHVDAYGGPVAFRVADPSDPLSTASTIVHKDGRGLMVAGQHFANRTRPGQHRGVPILAPVLHKIDGLTAPLPEDGPPGESGRLCPELVPPPLPNGTWIGCGSHGRSQCPWRALWPGISGRSSASWG